MSRSQLKNTTNSRNFNAPNTSYTIKGRVYSTILDEDHFFFKDILGEFDPTYIGWIYWGNLTLKQGGLERDDILKYCTLAKPYYNFITYHPLNTEIVEIIKGPSNKHYPALGGSSTNSEYFYYPPLNVWNNSAGNPLPSETDIQRNDGEIPLGTYTNEDKISTITNMLPFEGDMVLEGRFGNSIRFGSSNPRGKNDWSENDSEGDPITIISNGQESSEYTPLENINEDASSIYLTSNHNIQNFKISSTNFQSLGSDFREPTLKITPITVEGISNSFPIPELLNQPTLDSNPNLTTDLTENQPSNTNSDSGGTVEDEEGLREDDNSESTGYEDLVKIPGQYEDNRKKLKTLYLLPKKFSNGTKVVTDSIAKPLLRMLKAAEKDGVIIKVESAFRPPLNDIYLDGKFLQVSQKSLRIQILRDKYKGKVKEPWLSTTTCIEAFDNYKVGDTVTGFNRTKYFKKPVAPSYASNHGASLAIDFVTNNSTGKAYNWLCLHGWKYGFIRTVSKEDWHFDYKPSLAQKGPTAKLDYRYEPGKAHKQTKNLWNNVFGTTEPNWNEQWIAFQEQQTQQINDQVT